MLLLLLPAVLHRPLCLSNTECSTRRGGTFVAYAVPLLPRGTAGSEGGGNKQAHLERIGSLAVCSIANCYCCDPRDTLSRRLATAPHIRERQSLKSISDVSLGAVDDIPVSGGKRVFAGVGNPI